MRQWFTVLFLIALLVAGLAVVCSVRVSAEQTAVPSLPDFTKAPYVFVERLSNSPHILDDGAGVVDLYCDTGKVVKGESNVVGVYVDDDGKPTYAEWISVAEGPVIRGYQRTDGVWVFIQSKKVPMPGR